MTIAGLSLISCGFEPVYGTWGKGESVPAAEDYLSRIAISNIPDREGQYLRNALIDRFYRNGRPADPVYTLYVSPVHEDLTNLDITKTSDATRGQLRLTITVALQDKAKPEALLTRSLYAITSYNILASEFATRISEQNARENALDDLARQIEQQLGLYFNR